MFENIPAGVAERIRSMPPEIREPHLRHFAAAGVLLRAYLGPEILERKLDPFFRRGRQHQKGGYWEYPALLIQFAGLLFELRSDPGFPAICERMKTRDSLLSAWCELSGASMFKQHGFSIGARPRTGRRGDDFDFSASLDDCLVNVEVTAVRVQAFNPNTVRNALRQKRKQLPSDAPAVINCFVPQVWVPTTPNQRAQLDLLAGEFLRSTRRVNYLFFSCESFIETDSGGALIASSVPYRNENPRQRSDTLDHALANDPPAHGMIEALLKDTRPIVGSTLEFASWVDALLES